MILVWKLRRGMVGSQYPDTLFFLYWVYIGIFFGIFWGYFSVAVHWRSNDTGMETKEGNGREPISGYFVFFGGIYWDIFWNILGVFLCGCPLVVQ